MKLSQSDKDDSGFTPTGDLAQGYKAALWKECLLSEDRVY